jgi:ureidoacrylate peracid hydrolase
MHKHAINSWFLDKARKSRVGRLNAYETLDPARTALVVVDMQNYFVEDGMPSCAPVAREIVGNVNRLAEATRATGGLVVWIQTEALLHEPQDWANRKEATSPEGWSKRQRLLAKDGAGFPIYHTCEVKPGDTIALKTRYSAFIPYPGDLEPKLKARRIDTLLITGVATSTCCESTARDASMWGYRTIMVSDGNADSTDELHNHTLGKFLTTFGDVQSTDEVIAKLKAGRAGAATAAE